MSAPFDRVWRWRVNLPERMGSPCRVLARGALNSALIEFPDGERHVVSRFAYRKAPPIPHPVDVIEAVFREFGVEVDPERVAGLRAICDEPVRWP